MEEQTKEQEPLPSNILRKPKVTTTTMGERGPILPLGSIIGGTPHRDLVIKPWRMKEERELGVMRKENEDANMARYVSIVLGHMCTTLAGKDLTGLSEANRHLHIAQMWVPDIFHAYVYLRIKSMSERLKMKLKSPHGGPEFDWVGDLRSVEVNCVETLEDALWEYQLSEPLTIRNKTITRMVFGPQRWNVLEMIDGNKANLGSAKATVIASSLYSLPELSDGPTHITEQELDEMVKEDVERIAGYVNEYAIGPDMTLEPKDPNGRTFRAPIDWRHDHFFGSSSQ